MNNIPNIRFKGFSESWKNYEFKSIFNVAQGLQIPISERYLSEGRNRYFYITNEFLKEGNNVKYYIENPSENVICNKEDILMTRTGNTGLVVTDVEGCFHNNFFKIKYDSNLFVKYFICQLLSNKKMQKKILQSAGSSTIPDLSHKSFYKLNASFPEYEEQKKISELLTNINMLITLHQRKFEETKKIKQCMLQKLFPKKDCNIPEIRFDGYTEPWEQRKVLDEVDSIDTGKSKYVALETGDYKILGSTGVIGYDNSFDYEGDFLLTARVGANAGTLYRYTGNVKITDNTVFLQGQNIDFVYYLLDNFDLKKMSFGSGQPLIKASELKSLKLMIPTQNEEKEKIAICFANLDQLITLHQHKCDELKEIKEYMLSNMFPK